jgi:hypothetical protein
MFLSNVLISFRATFLSNLVAAMASFIDRGKSAVKPNLQKLYTYHEDILLALLASHFPEHLGSTLQLLLTTAASSSILVSTWTKFVETLLNPSQVCF